MMAVAYAEALYSLAKDENCTEEIYNQMPDVRFAFSDNPELSDILDRPGADLNNRYSLIDRCFADINVHLLNCIKVMCKRRVTSAFVQMTDEFMSLYRADNGIEKVTVITAEPLSEDLNSSLKSRLEDKLSKTVEMTVTVDPSIIGGIIVRTENTQIDSSIKTRLSDIEKRIKSVVLE